MKARWSKGLLPLFVTLALCLSFPGGIDSAQADLNHAETYGYKAVPNQEESNKEDIKLILSFGEDGITLASVSTSEIAEERTYVKMTKEGDLISGSRIVRKGQEGVTAEKIWKEEKKAYIERTSGHDDKTTIRYVPDGATLAIEGSLLVLFRFFPYDSGTQWDLFVINFTGKGVGATARQTGIEWITVPAGGFSCYRIEILFHVHVLNPKVVCWVAVEEPHFIVKSVGKRVILTSTYVTSLVDKR